MLSFREVLCYNTHIQRGGHFSAHDFTHHHSQQEKLHDRQGVKET